MVSKPNVLFSQGTPGMISVIKGGTTFIMNLHPIPPPATVASSSSSLIPPSSTLAHTVSSPRIDSLYEINYLDETDKVNITTLPILSPYKAFAKPKASLSRRVRTLIAPSKSLLREYVQATPFNQYQLTASHKEQYFDFAIPAHLPPVWLQEGFTHLHFGAIRFALTLHGRKGLKTSARMALLDTRFSKYENACIGTVESTLNAGTVIITMFPNFNMPIHDPCLSTALKLQVQLVGAVQDDPTTFSATLHYQMAYRLY